MQKLRDRIRQQYRVRLILDNLPITTYDLELDPESGDRLTQATQLLPLLLLLCLLANLSGPSLQCCLDLKLVTS